MFLELYLHLVRPLEYAVQVWSPKLLKDGERDRQTGGDFIHKM